uniref:Uncharacterized protein n=1 Tax=Anguilla anguilla TaxID=7936 RepID=A0A0E9QXH6_ANGAN
MGSVIRRGSIHIYIGKAIHLRIFICGVGSTHLIIFDTFLTLINLLTHSQYAEVSKSAAD